MLKSLYSGVSGLQSHQVAMDVESNNIANVNTVGYKYSRANFSDLLAQTKAIATAPQGNLGGKNAVQVGLGSTVSSTTRIFSQGSVQNTDKNTDLAVQGDGFFMISPDNGNTYQYTRAGDFKFDANGNFVDNNGFVVQGWLRDDVTGKVDSTAPITSINIAPGLTTPANPSAKVVIKANLNSGSTVESYSPAYEVASGTPPSLQTPAVFSGDALDKSGMPVPSGDMGVLFNSAGEALNLQENQGIWVSFQNSTATASSVVNASTYSSSTISDTPANTANSLVFTIDGTTITTTDTGTASSSTIPADVTGDRYASEINSQLAAAGKSNITATYDPATKNLFITNMDKSPVDITAVTDTGSSNMVVQNDIGGNQLDITFELDNGDLETIITTGGTGMETASQNAARYISAINAKTAITGVSASFDNAAQKIVLVNTNSSTSASHNIRLSVGSNDNSGLNNINDDTTAYRYQYSTETAFAAGADKKFKTISDLRYAMELEARTYLSPGTTSTTATSSVAADDDAFSFSFSDGVNPPTVVSLADTANDYTSEENAQRMMNEINAAGITGITASVDGATLTISNSGGTAYTVTATDAGNSGWADGDVNTIPAVTTALNNAEITVTDQGTFQLINNAGSPGDRVINLNITGITSKSVVGGGILENTIFTKNMEAMNTSLAVGSTGKALSQSFNAATHSSSIDIFDSLGSKHTIRTEFRKTEVNTSTGSTWDIVISSPEGTTIDTLPPYNKKTGSISFNSDGSLKTYSPPSFQFSANNGSASEQNVVLNFGSIDEFDGMTSFDSKSATSGISQDGYTGGDLVGIRIDQSGTLVGSFSNGRSFGLAQVAMAKFTNNEGLSVEGGNVYNQTANSGEPIIGTAATAGRGFIQASALEASNVDLSSALTQLIIIQRGYQANGKTITTSDTLLETLIGLKR